MDVPSGRSIAFDTNMLARPTQRRLELVVLDAPAQALFGRILMEFTQPCFPLLNNVDEIAAHPAAIVLAQGLAAGMDVVVSNNMRSIDHVEINGLVRQTFGRNTGLLLAADDALLEAHPCGEGSRALLAMALASAWPDDAQHMTLEDAETVVGSLCKRLEGATMPQTATRLRNRFATDGDLPSVLHEAGEITAASNALHHERVRTAWVKRGEVDASELPG